VTEGALLGFALEQGYGHKMILPSFADPESRVVWEWLLLQDIVVRITNVTIG
jgi:hypothetical protein